ncbi:ferritin-like domain-containing protein [Frigoriglobus tundricola]|uniref:DUF2383 domain-containing protein n=1 Tax=Frigoriglobus tundricola TaxID=2774151 RepID=A0A6M5Z283_9BACT|nr:ferritin-like domain-containing protein [Frigoriglobus tundricola]QJW99680.1 hypothetical protein FTUN_7299 [Frigoriglobus tundricola]
MNTTMYDPLTSDTTALNALLRGEMAAVEAYTRALGLFGDDELIGDLQKIRDDHSRAVRLLRDRVVQLAGVPAESSGAWSAFGADASATKVIGPTTALAALRQGEEHIISEYEAALTDAEISPDCHPMIQTDLLTPTQKHVDELNRLLGGQNRW